MGERKHNRNIKHQLLFDAEIISTFHLAKWDVKLLQMGKHLGRRWEIRENGEEKKELCHYIRIMQITNNILLQNIISSDCLKPIYNFLRAFGVFPLSRRSGSGEFQFSVQSASMAYSFLIFVALIVNMHLRFLHSLTPQFHNYLTF